MVVPTGNLFLCNWRFHFLPSWRPLSKVFCDNFFLLNCKFSFCCVFLFVVSICLQVIQFDSITVLVKAKVASESTGLQPINSMDNRKHTQRINDKQWTYKKTKTRVGKVLTSSLGKQASRQKRGKEQNCFTNNKIKSSPLLKVALEQSFS